MTGLSRAPSRIRRNTTLHRPEIAS